MKILLVSATPFETEPFVQQLKVSPDQLPEIGILYSGVGLLSSTYLIMKAIQEQKPELVIQAGIAGSFRGDLPPGSLTITGQDIAADICVKEPDGYRNMKDIGLEDNGILSGTGWLINPYLNRWAHLNLPVVNGVSVNEISTSPERISWFQNHYDAATESMEGAALHYVALMEKVPFLQLRSISNMVGERNKKHWKMKTAIDVLNDTLISVSQQIQTSWS